MNAQAIVRLSTLAGHCPDFDYKCIAQSERNQAATAWDPRKRVVSERTTRRAGSRCGSRKRRMAIRCGSVATLARISKLPPSEFNTKPPLTNGGFWPGPSLRSDSCQAAWVESQLGGAELACASGSSRPLCTDRDYAQMRPYRWRRGSNGAAYDGKVIR